MDNYNEQMHAKETEKKKHAQIIQQTTVYDPLFMHNEAYS